MNAQSPRSTNPNFPLTSLKYSSVELHACLGDIKLSSAENLTFFAIEKENQLVKD